MAVTFSGSPEQLTEVIRKGIASDLEIMIKKRLQEHIDPIISQLARDLADGTTLKMQSYMAQDHLNMTPKIQIAMTFNSKDVVYTNET